jgi:hypothetical protein
MKNEAIYEIAYVTPSGKHGRKQARQSKVSKVCMDLQERGYYNIKVSFHPLIPGVDPIV